MHRLRVVLAAAFLAVLIPGSTAWAQPFPRLALYGSVHGDGYPLWDSTGVVNGAALDQIARYHEVILDASPISEYRPDVAASIRIRRPDIRLLAYVTGAVIWPSYQPDSTVHFPTRYWRMVRDMNGFLYNTYGELFGTRHTAWANINLAKRDGSGHYVVAESLATLFNNAIVRTGSWDGIFVDTFCEGVLWMEVPTEHIDITRAGYPDRPSFDAGWKAGTDTLAARLRALAGPTQVLVGNCATGTKYAWFNGWMREDFPYQNGGTWFTNMFGDPGGWLVDEPRWRQPAHNYMFSAAQGPGTPYLANNLRKVRFGLGSASLADGYHVFGPSDRDSRPDQYMSWWYDEYGVDLSNGQTSARIQDTGWLGMPLGPAYQMILNGTGPDAVTNHGFETDVTTGWGFVSSIGSTRTRDTTSAPEGIASVHITVPSAVPAVPWATAFASLGTIQVFTNYQYSATFWARAARPRSIRVAASWAAGGGTYAEQQLTIDDQWRHYQVILVPYSSGLATLYFMLAGESGDVWLDDLHFQAGAHNVYRRDFQNGTVLVNPGDNPQIVTLEYPFQRLRGTLDPVTNDGSISATQTIPPWDAVFFLGSDHTPPAAIRDLHPALPGTAATRGQRIREP